MTRVLAVATWPCKDCGERPGPDGWVFHIWGCSLEALGRPPRAAYVQPIIEDFDAPTPVLPAAVHADPGADLPQGRHTEAQTASGRARPPAPASPTRTSRTYRSAPVPGFDSYGRPKRRPLATCGHCGVPRDAEGRYVHLPSCRITHREARRAA